MTTLIFDCLFVLVILATTSRLSCAAFYVFDGTHFTTPRIGLPSATLLSVGGKGWENNNYLESLGGNEQDREKAQQEYKDFHESRQAFLKRQEERSKTPEGQRFLQQKQQQEEQDWIAKRNNAYHSDDDGEGDFFANLGDSSGGSRFRRLMQQARRNEQKNQRTTFIDPSTGMEMKFAIPLDESDNDDADMS